jgi:hypothetical protein
LARCASTFAIACPVPIIAACVCAEYGSTMLLRMTSLHMNRLKNAVM